MSDETRALHDKLIRSYLFTLNKGGPTESNLSAAEVDLILLALKDLEIGPLHPAGSADLVRVPRAEE